MGKRLHALSSSKAAKIAGVAALALGGLLLLDALWLSGPRIYQGMLWIDTPFQIRVEEAGETWTFTIGSFSGGSALRRSNLPRRRRAMRFARLGYAILDDQGNTLFLEHDVLPKTIRRFSYRFPAAGDYQLMAGFDQQNPGYASTQLTIQRNDRSLLLRYLSHLWPVRLGVWSPFYPRQPIEGHSFSAP